MEEFDIIIIIESFKGYQKNFFGIINIKLVQKIMRSDLIYIFLLLYKKRRFQKIVNRINDKLILIVSILFIIQCRLESKYQNIKYITKFKRHINI